MLLLLERSFVSLLRESTPADAGRSQSHQLCHRPRPPGLGGGSDPVRPSLLFSFPRLRLCRGLAVLVPFSLFCHFALTHHLVLSHPQTLRNCRGIVSILILKLQGYLFCNTKFLVLKMVLSNRCLTPFCLMDQDGYKCNTNRPINSAFLQKSG